MIQVVGTFDFSYNIISLAEELEPVIEYSLLLVVQVIPIRHTFVGLERR